MLLQILDDGRLTDGQGATVDFRNTVIIMTSNLGSELWQDGKPEAGRDQITAVLRQHFRPEFINRIDEIVVFHKLAKDQLEKIVDIQLERVNHLIAEKGYKLEIDPDARRYLADSGYDPDFGARPLKRAIQRELQDPLAMKILSGEILPGSTIHVTRGKDGLEFKYL